MVSTKVLCVLPLLLGVFLACANAQAPDQQVEVTTLDEQGNETGTEVITVEEFRERYGAPPPPFELPPSAPIQNVLLVGALEAGQSQVQARVQNTFTGTIQNIFARFLFYPGPRQGEPGTFFQNLAGGLGRRRRLRL